MQILDVLFVLEKLGVLFLGGSEGCAEAETNAERCDQGEKEAFANELGFAAVDFDQLGGDFVLVGCLWRC